MGGGNSRAFRRFWDCFRGETWFYSVIDVYDISLFLSFCCCLMCLLPVV